MKNILAENMRRFGTKNLTEGDPGGTDKTTKYIGNYKISGYKFVEDPEHGIPAFVMLRIRDRGIGEIYVNVETEAPTVQEAYNKAVELFVDKRDRLTNYQPHIMYREEDPSTAIETIQPLKLEEL
jgi:hypothetical protein